MLGSRERNERHPAPEDGHSLAEVQSRLLDTMGRPDVDGVLPVGAIHAAVLSRDRNARLEQLLPTVPGGSANDVGSKK